MTIRDTFPVQVVNGDQLDDGYFNGIADEFDTSTGHDHDGTDSKAFGWVHQETKTISGASTTTFAATLPDKKIWKLIYRIRPDYAHAGDTSYLVLQINGDAGNNYNEYYISDNVNTKNIAQSSIKIGATRVAGALEASGIGECLIANGQGDVTQTSVTVNGHGRTERFLGGFWESGATITSLTLTHLSGNFVGTISLFYLEEAG